MLCVDVRILGLFLPAYWAFMNMCCANIGSFCVRALGHNDPGLCGHWYISFLRHVSLINNQLSYTLMNIPYVLETTNHNL